MKTADIKVTLINHMGSDLSVVNAARVSFDKESSWEQKEVVSIEEIEEGLIPIPLYYEYDLNPADRKLIKYLAKHKHFSPFNHAFLSFRVKAPIFVARQLVKHKFLPWNEVSRRYVDDEPEFYIPEVMHARADNVKQGCSEELADPNARNGVIINSGKSLEEYRYLLKCGVAPEEARMVLPGNMMTEWIWSGSLGAFLDMLVLRLDGHTQSLTRDVAQLIAKEVESKFPYSYVARIYNA